MVKEKDESSKVFTLDLKGTECPMNIIKAKSFLRKVPSGSYVDIILDFPSAFEDVPRALELEGYKIVSKSKVGENFMVVKVFKP